MTAKEQKKYEVKSDSNRLIHRTVAKKLAFNETVPPRKGGRLRFNWGNDDDDDDDDIDDDGTVVVVVSGIEEEYV